MRRMRGGIASGINFELRMEGKLYISVSIFLKGDQLDPDFVSKELGLLPDSSRRKGDVRCSKKPGAKSYTAKTGIWVLKSRDHIDTQNTGKEVVRIVDEVLQKFHERQRPLNEISGVEEAFLDIFVDEHETEVADIWTEFFLSREQILRFGQLGLALCVTTTVEMDAKKSQ
jgi:hypothetical protein